MKEILLNTQSAVYFSNSNLSVLRQRLAALLMKNSKHLAGSLGEDDEFTAYNNLLVTGWLMPKTPNKSAYVEGKLQNINGGTSITMHVRANRLLSGFAICSLLFGLLVLLFSLFTASSSSYLFSLGLFFSIVGIGYYAVSYWLRKRLLDKIVSGLELEEEN